MKNLLPALLLCALGFTACKKEKEPVNGGSTPIEFKATEYGTMGSVDAQGKPSYLIASDNISANLSNYVNAQIPERGDVRVSHPEYLKNADLAVTARSEVTITFVNEGTGFLNTVGYYLYKTGTPPKKPEEIQKITYMFPNASRTGSGGALNPGNKISLGVIESGMSIGFVLLENAWDPATSSVNVKAAHYCSNKELNPENLDEFKQHTVLIDFPAENKTIIGFEDLNRTTPKCDHDFNDVVIFATVTPK